jgi:acetyl esterase
MAPVAKMSDAEVIALQARRMPDNAVSRRIFGAVPPGVEATDQQVPGPDGQLPVRVYRPAGTPAGTAAGASAADGLERPLVVYFHGGGFVLGNLDLGSWICGTVADRVGAVVVSVEYRLAPTHRFPAAVEDSYAALAWAAANAADLGAGGPVGVMGESAGGTLAAVVCLMAKERGGPAVAHQALIYPAVDLTTKFDSANTDPHAPFLSAADRAAYNRLYLGPDGDPAHPWVSPVFAADHTGLPPALIQVGEHDPLREGGARYAALLRAAGVPVRFTEYVGVPHGFVNFPGLSRAAHQALAEVCAEQSAAFATSAAATAQDAIAEDTAAPDTTAPDTTAPDTTAPDTTAPDTTAPKATAQGAVADA